jgi:hypothetical protein
MFSNNKIECFTEGVGAPLVNFPDNLKSENLNNHVSNLTIEKKNSQMNAKNNIKNKEGLVTQLQGSIHPCQFLTFLNNNKATTSGEFTHTSIDQPQGRFNISSEDKDTLVYLLHNYIFNHGYSASLTGGTDFPHTPLSI